MFSSEAWLSNSSDFYNSVATQSLRYNDDDNPYLSKTFSASNAKTWTWSGWVKLSSTTVSNSFIYSQLSSGADVSWLYFTSNNQLNMQNYEGGNQLDIMTNAKFRDTSAWYHIMAVLDTTQSTSTDRAKMYVNGELQTSLANTTYPSQNADLKFNNGDAPVLIGGTPDSYGTGEGYKLDGYLAEVNFIDGQALDPTYFGETKNGVWIPKAYTGSYGTNGFRLQFNQTGTGTASSSTIGADTSGNANHFTSSGIVASDCDMPDSPENNFCIYNPLDPKGNDNTFSEGNLEVVISAQNTDEQTTGTFAVSSGKWYWEIRANSTTTTGGYFKIGLRATDADGSSWTVRGNDGETEDSSGSQGSSTVSYTTNNVIGIYLDMDNSKWYVSVDGVLQNSADLTNGTGFIHNNLTGELRPFILNATSGGTHTVVGNFGQDSTFAGEESAGGNSDANGNGDFHSAVTSPYLALCSANLPEPTISPNETTQADDYFNTVTYTGNGSTQSITGVGFQPDWVWIKQRNGAENHFITDVIRGAGIHLRSDQTSAENDDSATFTSFDSDGFSLTGTGPAEPQINDTSDTYVAWNWKAGGTAVLNEQGSIDSNVSANTDAGFSIVTYTGTGASSATIGHGLGAVPKWIIVKNRSEAYNWKVYHASNTSAPETDYLVLDTTDATADASSHWNDTAPTSSVFSIGSSNALIKNTNTFVAYCFAEIEGFSKFGSYTGNGSTDGTFVYTGFRPAWLMVKVTNISGENWHMFDSERASFNVMKARLVADDSFAENTNDNIIDFTSNGFKWRDSNAGYNGSGNTYIFMCFAENPFKYANAR
jgi:hypothetical protein